MSSIVEDILNVAQKLVYLHSADIDLRLPADVETASLLFVEQSGYVAGFISLATEERMAVENLLRFGVVNPPDVVSLSVDSPMLIGNGDDEIILSVRGVPLADVTIDVLTGATSSTILLTLDADGNAEQPFSCETAPCVIVFSAGDVSCKVMAL